jgi:hypothetical protein
MLLPIAAMVFERCSEGGSVMISVNSYNSLLSYIALVLFPCYKWRDWLSEFELLAPGAIMSDERLGSQTVWTNACALTSMLNFSTWFNSKLTSSPGGLCLVQANKALSLGWCSREMVLLTDRHWTMYAEVTKGQGCVYVCVCVWGGVNSVCQTQSPSLRAFTLKFWLFPMNFLRAYWHVVLLSKLSQITDAYWVMKMFLSAIKITAGCQPAVSVFSAPAMRTHTHTHTHTHTLQTHLALGAPFCFGQSKAR